MIDFGFWPDPASVPVHDPLNDGEPNPGSLVVLAPVQSLEDAEQLVRVIHVEARAVVLDEVHGLAVGAGTGPDLDPGRRAASAVLEAIADQVDEDLIQQVRIALAGRKLADRDFARTVLDAVSQLLQRAIDHAAGLDRLPSHRLAVQPGEAKQVVHQPAHELCVARHQAEIAAGFDMLAVGGFDGFFKRLNPSWERTLGWSEAELLARPYMESLKNRLSSSFGTVISWVMGLLAK